MLYLNKKKNMNKPYRVFNANDYYYFSLSNFRPQFSCSFFFKKNAFHYFSGLLLEILDLNIRHEHIYCRAEFWQNFLKNTVCVFFSNITANMNARDYVKNMSTKDKL